MLLLCGLAILGEAGDSHTARGEVCVRPAVDVRYYGRASESTTVSFTQCDGSPNLDAVVPLSILTRPRGTEVPSRPRRQGVFVGEGVRRLDPRLLVRMQRIADQWPGKQLEIVSGFRPRARRGSRHRLGRALDVRVVGIHRARVANLSRTWARTGVGFYPNSTFTHIDVRDEAAFWVDRSAPGERARYVSNDDEVQVLERALARLGDPADNPLSPANLREAARSVMEAGLLEPSRGSEVTSVMSARGTHQTPVQTGAPAVAMSRPSSVSHHVPSAPMSAIVRRESEMNAGAMNTMNTMNIDWGAPW